MTDGPRALLTDREKDAIRGDEDINDSTRRSLLGRVRQKVEKMSGDARLLRENRPDLAAALHDAVCREETEERLDSVEDELAELREQLEEVVEDADENDGDDDEADR